MLTHRIGNKASRRSSPLAALPGCRLNIRHIHWGVEIGGHGLGAGKSTQAQDRFSSLNCEAHFGFLHRSFFAAGHAKISLFDYFT